LKSIVSAANSLAFASRSGSVSTAKIPCPQELGADDGEQPDGAAAEHADRVARLDLGHVRAEIPGGEDVGEQDGLVVGHPGRKLDQRRIGQWHAGEFGLEAVEGPSRLRAAEERRPSRLPVGVGVVALRLIPRGAVRAMPAADGRGDDHPVADLEVAHRRADLLDDSHPFMTKDRAGHHARHRPADHVQVGATDGARREADDSVRGLLDLRLGDVVEADVPDSVEYDGLHQPSCVR
jgi:hypothetical protein